jgi:putative addiction module component (TIGR02574 family)
MSASFHVPDLGHLSVAERIIFVEQIWDGIAAEQEALPLTAAQEAELDRRLKCYRNLPIAGSSWEEVKGRIQARKWCCRI